MDEQTPEVKLEDATSSPASEGEQKTEPSAPTVVAGEAELAKQKLQDELDNLQKAKDEALQELQRIRQDKKEEEERVANENIDPTSKEYLEKIARQQAERVNRKERAADTVRARYNISLSDWENKVLPRYIPLSGERSISGTTEDYEAAVRAGLPYVIAKSVEEKLRTENAQTGNQMRDTHVNATVSSTLLRNATGGTKLTAEQQEMKRVEERASGKVLTDEEFLEKYRRTGTL